MPRLLVTLVAALGALGAYGIDFTRFHTHEEINAYLTGLAEEHPNVITLLRLGKSQQGRDLFAVAIGSTSPGSSPAIFLNGTHHGDEKSSTESALAVIDHFVGNLADPEIAALLRSYELVIQPIVNPDGHAANRREDIRGRDPNRDYAFPEQSEEASFRLVEIAAVKSLFDRFRFRAAIAYHSGMEAVLWPWCYSGAGVSDKNAFYTLSKRAGDAMGFRNVRQSYYDYPSRGEFIDYAYLKQGTLAVTMEVSAQNEPAPNRLPAVVKRAVAGTLAYLKGIAELDGGMLRPEAAPRFGIQDFNPMFRLLGKKVE